MIAQQKAAFRRESDAKPGDVLIIQPTPGEVLARICRFRTPQLPLKKISRALVNLKQGRAQSSIFRLSCGVEGSLRQWDSDLLCDQAHRFRKGDVLQFLDKAEDVSGNAATKTVVELPRRMHGKRGSLLAVEWAQPGEVLRPRFLQFDVVAHN